MLQIQDKLDFPSILSIFMRSSSGVLANLTGFAVVNIRLRQ